MKKYILGLFIIGLISGLTFGMNCFVNAVGYIYEFNKFSPSQVNSVYEINVYGNGNLQTSFGGVVKKLIWWNNGKYFFWQENGLPYYRFDNNNYGTIKNYYICPKSTTFDNCTCNTYPCSCSRNIQYYCNSDGGLKTVGSGTVDIFKNYLGLLNNNDSYYYMEFINGTQPFLCFIAGNSSNVLCFNGIGQYISHENGEINYGGDFDNISDSILFNPPSGGQNNGGGNTIPSTINNNYYCPTIRQVMANMGTQYNTGLCYNGTLKYENGTITTVQKQDIFTVFTDYNEYTQRISLYNENCTTPNTTNNCQNVFNGEFEKYSIIANAVNNNTNPKKLWNYCNMGLNYDLNATTCVASGYIQEQPTEQELINDIINGQYTKITNISTPNIDNTGNVMNAMLGSGQTRDDTATRDILGQVEQIKNKLQSLFIRRNGVEGIIPDYILYIILMTLLLTVLLKK